jgi:peptide/nickel transport system substrate-binding protein
MKHRSIILMAAVLAVPAWVAAADSRPQPGGELRFCVRADPKTFNPILVEDEPGETVRYLTAGVLIRLNRITQELEPELAKSWKVRNGGRTIEFELREGLRFSDGSPLGAAEVAFTMRTLLDPNVHSVTGDMFRGGSGSVTTAVKGRQRVEVTFSQPVAGMTRFFDQVPIVSARALPLASRPAQMPVAGPYRIAEYKPGSHVLLVRNPYYWKKDAAGRAMPYLERIRISIQQNRDLEMLRFLRGEVDFVAPLDAESFTRLASSQPAEAVDAGPGLDSEFMWFNQVPGAPLPAYKKEWFRSTEFRRAISQAINRQDLCRVVYHKRAVPAAGPVSPANRFWYNSRLKPEPHDPGGALARLQRAGFHQAGGALQDRQGHRVEFSIITNSGNKARERMAAMMQQDLAQIGIRLNVVTLDFPSLIERMTRSFNYEACLLGLTNVDLDPNAQMNVWVSSADMHQWNPGQKTPATPWEAEIDKLMRAQSAELSQHKRKALFDRVQEIIWEQAPFIYLVHPDALCAISARLKNVAPAVFRPQTFWNVERLYLAGAGQPVKVAKAGAP